MNPQPLTLVIDHDDARLAAAYMQAIAKQRERDGSEAALNQALALSGVAAAFREALDAHHAHGGD